MAEQWQQDWAEQVAFRNSLSDQIIAALRAWIADAHSDDPRNTDLFRSTTTTKYPNHTSAQNIRNTESDETDTFGPVADGYLLLALFSHDRFAVFQHSHVLELTFLLKQHRAVTYLDPSVEVLYPRTDRFSRMALHRDVDALIALGLVRKGKVVMPEGNEFRGQPADVFMVWNATEEDRRGASLTHWRVRRGQMSEEPPETATDREAHRLAGKASRQDEDQDAVFVRSFQRSMRAGHKVNPKSQERYDAIVKARPELAQEKEVQPQ
jgi:hypothetical protein